MNGFSHIPVLLEECMEQLALKDGGDYLDCTLGGGGHSSEILRRISGGTLIGIDRDSDALTAANSRINDSRFRSIKGNFHDAGELTGGMKFDGILADLGVSSYQLDMRERGFSYHDDAPLDMRMDAQSPLTAADIVNSRSEDELTKILYDYSEEKWARQIARVIVDRRKTQPILTTLQLVDIIDAAIPKKFREKDGSHPARRTFQALRIAVNDELEPLGDALEMLCKMLKPGGRLCVITFHSLEDRIVKNTFKRLINPCICPRNIPICVCGRKPIARAVTRKPITASEEELKNNQRARSASLRVIERL